LVKPKACGAAPSKMPVGLGHQNLEIVIFFTQMETYSMFDTADSYGEVMCDLVNHININHVNPLFTKKLSVS
jgi:hypothetical protein